VVLLGALISSRNTGVEEPWESCPYERGGEGTEWHSSSRIDVSVSYEKRNCIGERMFNKARPGC
jgi:hypothetical protein